MERQHVRDGSANVHRSINSAVAGHKKNTHEEQACDPILGVRTIAFLSRRRPRGEGDLGVCREEHARTAG